MRYDLNKGLVRLMVLFAILALVLALGGYGGTSKAAAKAKVSFPTKSINLICWSSAGSPIDVTSRMLAKSSEKLLGKSIEVMTKQGGGGSSAVSYLLSRPADGHTLLTVSASLTELLNKQGIPFKVDDLIPLIRLQSDPYCVIVPGNSPIKTLKDLVEMAKSKEGAVSVSGPFAGGAHYVAFFRFMKLANFKVNWIPFEGGSEAVTNVIGGHSTAGHTNPGNIKEFVAAGKLRILVVSAAERLRSFPEVPTYKELGYDLVAYHWRGVVAKKGMPPEVAQILHDNFKKAAEGPEFQSFLKNVESLYGYLNTEDFTNLVRTETELMAKIAREIEKK